MNGGTGLERLRQLVDEMVRSDEGLTWLALITVAHAVNLDEAEPVQRAVFEGREPEPEDVQRLGLALCRRGTVTQRVGILLEGLGEGLLDWGPRPRAH